MKLIYTFPLLFLLSSCVYYGTSRDIDFGDKTQTTCASGTSKENKNCRDELRRLNESIAEQTK